MFETPVALLIFNRPEQTRRVFAEVARAKPRRLLVVADGPRADRPGEAEACRETRSIVQSVGWDCEVLTNFAETNMGCRERVASGISWVFEQAEEAVILEDDCVPHPSFFPYCAELLARYREDERVMMVSGDNFQEGRERTPHSYYFSCLTHIWGWASWRRAWRHYDVGMGLWPELRGGSWLADALGDAAAAEHLRASFDRVYAGEIDTWDFQWMFACLAQSGLAVLPSVNLVTNIGWGENATHTKQEGGEIADLPAFEMTFPLRHPAAVTRHYEADRHTFAKLWTGAPNPGLLGRLLRKARSLAALPARGALIQPRAKEGRH
ncbi:MAG TPA: hypothetical protein VGV38_15125 [Pyrinomonadaceae bacterium]|nr:hypothetical protein [Pyrinomonadaceae bacterium]